MLMALSNIKINSTKELKNVIKHARPLLGQIERKRTQRYEVKRASSETTTHKRAKFEMDNTKNRNILPKKTKVNDYSHNLLKHKSIDPKNSLVLHDYGTEFPPLPTSSDRSRQSQELYSGEHKNEVEGLQKSKSDASNDVPEDEQMCEKVRKSSKTNEISYQRNWQNTQLGDQIRDGHSRRHTSFTVMSYNVLSDDLMKRHKELYSQSSDLLDWEKRWRKIIKEIERHNPDILCFQEVQCDHYETDFIPDLGSRNFVGLYKKRTGDKDDGCAIFYKKDKFILEDFAGVEYHQPYTKSLNRDNIGLITKFRPVKSNNHKDNKRGNKNENGEVQHNCDTFVVATTHLLYNPKRDDVRLAQIALLFAELDHFAYKTEKDLKFRPPRSNQEYYYPCIITGDFNLNPSSPIYDFVNDGHIDYRTSTSARSMPLIPLSLGVTDSCQHLNVILSRCQSLLPNSHVNIKKSIRTYNGRTEVIFSHEWLRESWMTRLDDDKFEYKKEQEVPQSISELNHTSEMTNFSKQQLEENSHLFNSGTLHHALAIRSVYKNRRKEAEVTTKQQNGWVTVDYILYSTSFSEKYNKFIEGNLKLVSRLELLSEQQCRSIGSLPSYSFPSDHLSLVAKFLLCS